VTHTYTHTHTHTHTAKKGANAALPSDPAPAKLIGREGPGAGTGSECQTRTAKSMLALPRLFRARPCKRRLKRDPQREIDTDVKRPTTNRRDRYRRGGRGGNRDRVRRGVVKNFSKPELIETLLAEMQAQSISPDQAPTRCRRRVMCGRCTLALAAISARPQA